MKEINAWEEKYQECILKIIHYGALGHKRGLTSGTGGNISCRCGNGVLITAGGSSLRDMEENDILLVDMDGNIVEKKGDMRPSKETMFHLAIYRARNDVNCIYHAHPPFATSYAVKNKEIPFLTCSAKINVGVAPLVEYAPAGSKELSELIEKKIREFDESLVALVLSGHGIVTFAADMERAYNIAELLEDTARIALYSGLIRE